MNNRLSYCGLTDARMRASEKDLPVLTEKISSYNHAFLSTCIRLCNRKKRIMVPFFQSSDLMSRSIYTYFRMTLLYSWATYQYYEDPLVFTGKVMKYDIWS